MPLDIGLLFTPDMAAIKGYKRLVGDPQTSVLYKAENAHKPPVYIVTHKFFIHTLSSSETVARFALKES